jgi:protein-histidine pros-kinase
LEAIQEKLANVLDLKRLVSDCVAQVKEIVMNDVVYGVSYLGVRLTPIKMVEEDNRVIGVVLLLEDMTREKRLQQARDEFFAVAAHELRTPLTAISGLAQMIQHYYPQAVADKNVAEMVKDIGESSTRLIAIVNEYLDVSRAELNKMQVQMETVDLVAVVGRVIEELRPTAVAKGLELVLEGGEKALWVQADAARARQVIMNLVGNAIKYTQKGKITVKMVRTDINAKVYVRDTGVGISLEDQNKLFQKFKTVGDRVYDKGLLAGTGMGLYISRLLAEAMGGRVYLEQSVPGQGSCFVLELPWRE